MLSVRAIYDGKEFRLREKLNIKTPKEVIITFLEPIGNDEIEDPGSLEIHRMVQEGGALDFLNDEREDIYSDDDLKVKYVQ
jgi:hypothetical protein